MSNKFFKLALFAGACAIATLSQPNAAYAQINCDPSVFLQRDIDVVQMNTNTALAYMASSSGELSSSERRSLSGSMGLAVDGVPLSGVLSSNQLRSASSRIANQLGINYTQSQQSFLLRQSLNASGIDAYTNCLRSKPVSLDFSSDPVGGSQFVTQIYWGPSTPIFGSTKLELLIENGKFKLGDGTFVERVVLPIAAQVTERLIVVGRNTKLTSSITAKLTTHNNDQLYTIGSDSVDIPPKISVVTTTSQLRVPIQASVPAIDNSPRGREACLKPSTQNAFLVPSSRIYSGDSDPPSPKIRRRFSWLDEGSESKVCGSLTVWARGDQATSASGTIEVTQITYARE